MTTRQKEALGFGLILLAAALLRFPLAAGWYNAFDLVPYNIPWAKGMGEYGLSVYASLSNVDYPPLFLVLLWPLSQRVAAADALGDLPALMFWIKLWPVVFDLGLVALLGALGRRRGIRFGYAAALFWALNPAAIFNCAVWGQTDCILLFFIVLCAGSFYDRKPLAGTVWFAVGCLAKLQMAYFAPVLLLELFVHYRPRKAVRCLLAGLLTGVLGWLPFMVGAGSWTLPFSTYFGGFGKYNYLDLNAFNVYGMFSANWVPDTLSIFGGTPDAETGWVLGGFCFRHLNTLVTLGLLAALALGYFLAWRHRASVPFAAHALFLLNGIFLLTTKMHERYQLPAVLLLVLCWVLEGGCRLGGMSAVLSGIAFLNQMLLLFSRTLEGWDAAFSLGQPLLSLLNVECFLLLAWWHFRRCCGKASPFCPEAGNGLP